MPSKNKGNNKYRLTEKGKKEIEDDMFSIKHNDGNEENTTMIVHRALYELRMATAKEISEKTGIKITSIGLT